MEFTLADAALEVSGGIAVFILKKALSEGATVHIPSLGLIITPAGELIETETI